jgi:non-ribosomal peptide synthetase component E (peptide arylation enzyme)
MTDAIADSAPPLERVAVTADGSDPPSGWTGFEELRDSAIDGSQAIGELEVNPCNPGLLMLSGGTSGLPKLIPRTHNDYLYQWEHIAAALEVGEDWTFVAGIPVGHSFTVGYILGPALWCGGTVALEPALKPGPLAETIDRVSGDVTALIPKQLFDLLDQDDEHDLRTLRVVCSGGQKVPPELTRRIVDRWDVGFSHVFGMGEGPQLITRPNDPLEVQATTVGRPLGDADEVRILDPEGRPVDEGEPGELVFRGPGLTSGYLRNPEANAEAFEPSGWFHTGDVVSRREDGNYEVWGRLDDTINRAGETIYAPAVEDALVEHPAIKKAAVVGLPDEELGERVGAAVEQAEDGTGLRLDEVASYLADEGYAVYQRPERLILVDELPETQVGKLDRAAVKGWFDEDASPEGTRTDGGWQN